MFGKLLIICLSLLYSPTLLVLAAPGTRDPNATPVPAIVVNGFSVEGDLSYTDVSQGLYYKSLGDLMYQKRAYPSAIRYYELALPFLPNEADLYFNLANAYYFQNLYGMACEYYLTAREKYGLPENSEKRRTSIYLTQLRLASSYFSLGQNGIAEKVIQGLASFRKEAEYDSLDIISEWDTISGQILGLGVPRGDR